MNPEEALTLCKFAKAACPQQAIDQDTPAAWAMLLDDIRYQDAQEALKNVVRDQPFVSPSEIRAEVKRIRAKRVIAFGPIPDPPREVGDDPARYRAWIGETQRAIADGRVTKPEEVGRLPGPPSKRPLELEGVFRKVDDVEPVEGEDADPEVVEGSVVAREAGAA